MKKFYLFILLSLVGEFAQAAIVGVNGKITRLGTGFTGDGLYISIDQPTPSICPNSYMLFMSTGAPQYKETVSMALAAQAQSRTITIYYDSSTCPRGDIPTFIAIGVN